MDRSSMGLFRFKLLLASGLTFIASLSAMAEMPLAVDQRQIDLGEAIFLRQWQAASGEDALKRGLGPLFNARSCVSCHINNGRGRPLEPDLDDPSFLLRLSIPPQNEADRLALAMGHTNLIGEPHYGQQLQPLATGKGRGEGRVIVRWHDKAFTHADGELVMLRRPSYFLDRLNYGPLHKDVQISPRIAQPLFGLGLIARITDRQILAREDGNDEDGDGISGRANRVRDLLSGKIVLGRFGWKATEPNLRQQIAGALARDMGISSQLFPRTASGCDGKKANCVTTTIGRSNTRKPDIDMTELDQLGLYVAALPPQESRNGSRKAYLDGRQLFDRTGCSRCHTPSYSVQINDRAGKSRSRSIEPYSDFLLHDMGAGLADHRRVARASGWEWRTQPLWGIGREINGNAFYLHDGRARTIEEAIVWHGGEARKARAGFSRLSKAERARLVGFVRGL